MVQSSTGGKNMATSSIFADFSIRDPKKAARFVDAVYQSMVRENGNTSPKKPRQDVIELKTVSEIKNFIRRSRKS